MCKLSFRPEAEFGHQMIRPLHTLVISVCSSTLLCAALQKTEKWGIRLLMKMAWAPSHWHPGLWRMWVWLWNPPAGSDLDLHTHLLSMVPGAGAQLAFLVVFICSFPAVLVFIFLKLNEFYKNWEYDPGSGILCSGFLEANTIAWWTHLIWATLITPCLFEALSVS